MRYPDPGFHVKNVTGTTHQGKQLCLISISNLSTARKWCYIILYSDVRDDVVGGIQLEGRSPKHALSLGILNVTESNDFVPKDICGRMESIESVSQNE